MPHIAKSKLLIDRNSCYVHFNGIKTPFKETTLYSKDLLKTICIYFLTLHSSPLSFAHTSNITNTSTASNIANSEFEELMYNTIKKEWNIYSQANHSKQSKDRFLLATFMTMHSLTDILWTASYESSVNFAYAVGKKTNKEKGKQLESWADDEAYGPSSIIWKNFSVIFPKFEMSFYKWDDDQFIYNQLNGKIEENLEQIDQKLAFSSPQAFSEQLYLTAQSTAIDYYKANFEQLFKKRLHDSLHKIDELQLNSSNAIKSCSHLYETFIKLKHDQDHYYLIRPYFRFIKEITPLS